MNTTRYNILINSIINGVEKVMRVQIPDTEKVNIRIDAHSYITELESNQQLEDIIDLSNEGGL